MKTYILMMMVLGAGVSAAVNDDAEQEAEAQPNSAPATKSENKKGADTESFIKIDAPAPAAAARKTAEFLNRRSEASIRRLCDDFFGCLHDRMDITKPAFALYRAGKYQEALDSYRDAFVDRLVYGGGFTPIRISPNPEKAEDEMNNLLRLWAAEADIPLDDKELGSRWREAVTKGKRVSLKANLGEPGSMNYTFIPKGYVSMENQNAAGWVHNETRKFPFTNSLLEQYAVSGNAKYLKKWSEYLDALHMQWCAAGGEAGLKVDIWVNELEWYTNVFWPRLVTVARTRPDLRKDLDSATLATSLLYMWRVYVPVQMRLARSITGNRLSHMYTQKFLQLGQAFPEFVFSDYVLREKRRAMEVYPVASAFPDGGDVNFAYNYEFNWPDVAVGVMNNFSQGKPGYMTPEWKTYMEDAIIRKYRKQAHDVHVDGSTPHWRKPGKDYEFKWRDVANQNSTRLMAPWLTDFSDNLRILNTVYGDGSLGIPGFNSEGFPYVGFYHLRSGWSKQDQDLFFCAYRPICYHGESMNLHIRLYAFGRELICNRNGGRLDVDGCPKIEEETGHNYPAEQLSDWQTNRYGLNQFQMGADDILPYRFHTSGDFGFCESSYRGAFASNGPPAKFFDDVIQTRQISFVRDAGIWIVTDRIAAKGKHDYSITWEFPRKGKAGASGFAMEEISIDEVSSRVTSNSASGANFTMHVINDAPSKLFPVGADVSVDRLPSGWVGRYLKETETIHLVNSFSGEGERIWTTVIYPRRQGAQDLTEIKFINSDGVNGFDAVTPDGRKVQYRCSLYRRMLEAGNAKAEATMLLLSGDNGIALDAVSAEISGKKLDVVSADFQFGREIIPIYRPLGLVTINPGDQNVFSDKLEISLSHPAKDIDIHYTTDRSEPNLDSKKYSGPFVIADTTMVKAIAVRKGVKEILPVATSTHVSIPSSAIYSKRALWPAADLKNAAGGLAYSYYQGDFTLTGVTFPHGEKKASGGTVKELFDISAKTAGPKDNYGLIYEGFIKVPTDGVYTFHAPVEFMHWGGLDASYDLRVFLDGQEWYPGTFRHNFRRWSVPLKEGFHAFKVFFVDVRGGDEMKRYWFSDEKTIIGGKEMWRYRIWDGITPDLMISGPGIGKRKIPSEWLYTGDLVKK